MTSCTRHVQCRTWRRWGELW